MARSAKQVKKRKAAQHDGLVLAGARSLGAFVAHNPTLVGGTAAFAIAMSFVTANAIWYQPYAHTAPLFSTRTIDVSAFNRPVEHETTIRLDREAAPTPSVRPEPPARPAGDVALRRVQEILKDLGYYKGDVDGMNGPATMSAISAYQRKMGMASTGQVDKNLLSELGAGDVTGSIEPISQSAAAAETVDDVLGEPAPAASQDAAVESPVTAGESQSSESGENAEPPIVAKKPSESLKRLQMGLRNAGFDAVTADGFMGDKTRDALRQFQTQHNLEATGEPDVSLYETMLDLGLLNGGANPKPAAAPGQAVAPKQTVAPKQAAAPKQIAAPKQASVEPKKLAAPKQATAQPKKPVAPKPVQAVAKPKPDVAKPKPAIEPPVKTAAAPKRTLAEQIAAEQQQFAAKPEKAAPKQGAAKPKQAPAKQELTVEQLIAQ